MSQDHSGHGTWQQPGSEVSGMKCPGECHVTDGLSSGDIMPWGMGDLANRHTALGLRWPPTLPAHFATGTTKGMLTELSILF